MLEKKSIRFVLKVCCILKRYDFYVLLNKKCLEMKPFSNTHNIESYQNK